MQKSYKKQSIQQIAGHKKPGQINNKRTNASKWINIIVIVGLCLYVVYGLISTNSKLKKSDVTTCKIVNFEHSSGGSGVRPEVVYYEYCIKGVVYKSHSFFPMIIQSRLEIAII